MGKGNNSKISGSMIPAERIGQSIRVIRDLKVMLDSDLAELYGVETRVLVQAVKRNVERFPADFMFRLTAKEFDDLKSQIVTSSWGGRRTPPYAFTEQGVAMLSSVLRSSSRAVLVNIEIVRTFIALREMLSTHKDLARRLSKMEQDYDAKFKVIFDALRQMMRAEETPKPQIGFQLPEKKKD